VAESFDAYHRWLGIPPKDHPPNHYRLLALELFESDPDVIESAADRQMGHLRTYQTGKHADLSQRLLNEVATAKVCLLNPPKKAAYDAALRQRLAPAASSPHAAEHAPQPGGVGIDPAVAGLIERADAAAYGQGPSATGWRARRQWGLAVGILAAGVAAFVLIIALTIWPRGSQDHPSNGARPPDKGVAASGLGRGNEHGGTLQSPRVATRGLPSDPAKPEPSGPQPDKVGVPESKKSGPGAMPPVIPWPSPPQGVLPAPPEPAKEPSKTDGPPPAPAAKVAADEKTPPPGQQPPLGGEPGPGEKTPLQPAPTSLKSPVPSDADQQKARKLILDVYQQEYKDATAPAEQLALAKKLLGKAQLGDNAPAERFVLLMIARELAEQARDWETTAQLIDELAAGFTVDAASMKTEVLEGFAKLARQPPDHAAIAEAALLLVDEAVAKDDLALAGRILKLAQSEAGKSRNRDLQVAARAGGKQVQAIIRSSEQVQAARETLKANPQDPEANLVLGRHQCFVCGDWAAGLPHLAASSDQTLKSLAQKDLAAPESPEEKAAVGDQWWDLGEKEEPWGQKRLRLRAAYWYHAAISGLVGVLRDRVQQRLQEVASLETTAGSDPRKPLSRAYEGTWIVRFSEVRWGNRYVIEANGDVTWGPYHGQLTRLNGDTVIDFRRVNMGLDRVKLVHTAAGDTLSVERFEHAAAYPKDVPLHGEGRRLKKDAKLTPARLLRPLQGAWLVKYGNKASRLYFIDATSGIVVWQVLDARGKIANAKDKKQGHITVRDGEILLDFQDGSLERLEYVAQALWVEFFRPPTEYPHTIAFFGVGVKQ
jgi:hypothetical protein